MFPCPEKDDRGQYHIHFFAHGLSHLPAETLTYLETLQPGEVLQLAHDLQNPYDRKALMLRTKNLYIVGFCPRYLAADVFDLLCQSPDQLKVVIEQINLPPTPLQFRILCSLTTAWADGFEPFTQPLYQPLVPQYSEVFA